MISIYHENRQRHNFTKTFMISLLTTMLYLDLFITVYVCVLRVLANCKVQYLNCNIKILSTIS